MTDRDETLPDAPDTPESSSSDEEGNEFLDHQGAFFRYVLRSMALQRQIIARSNEELVRDLQNSETLKTQNIIDAFLLCPREDFLLADMIDEAYTDHPLRFSTMGFNISAPHVYAMCLESLQLEEGHTFLDIGSGCGLLTLIGAVLVGKTGIAHGLEVRKDIIQFSEKNCSNWKAKNPDVGINLSFELRNCFLVDPEERLWDRIHVGACCPESKLEELFELLKPGGKLVTPYGEKLIEATKNEDNKIDIKNLANVRYGDLIIPSEAEKRQALINARTKKRSTIIAPEIQVPKFAEELKLDDESTSDYKLIVEGRTIHTHRSVLRDGCQHFAVMFDSGMVESNSQQLTIEDFTYSQVYSGLQVIYTGSCDVNSENAVELLEISDFYKLEWLKSKCEQVLFCNIEVETATPILAIADRYDARQLRTACFEFILNNYEAVQEVKGFDQLEKNLIIEFALEACSRLKDLL